MRILIAAILCAVVCITSIAFSIDAIRNQLANTTTLLLGGDRVVVSSQEINPHFYDLINKYNLKGSSVISFYSMLTNNNDMLLSSIKAADNNYPLLGEIKITTEDGGSSKIVTHAPKSGEVWLERRAFLQLGPKINDDIQIGDASLKVTSILVQEPDRLADGFTFAPRAFINIADVTKTKAIVPGSRVTYKLLITGDTNNLRAFDQELKNYDLGDYVVQTIDSSNNNERNLNLATRYLNIALFLNIILAGVTVAIIAMQYSNMHTRNVAVLKSLGCTFQQIILIYSANLLIISLLVGIVGSAIGLALEQVIAMLLAKYLNIFIAKPNSWPMLLGIGTAIGLVSLFGLPAIFKLARTTPISILHSANAWDGDPSWQIHFNLSNKIPALFRLSLNNIAYNSKYNFIQISALATIIFCACALWILRTDLLATWGMQLSKGTPNYFVLNISREQITDFSKFLNDNNIKASEFYPIIRGTLVKINQQIVNNQEVDNSNQRQGINRPLNLTWTVNLPYANKILQGAWFKETDKSAPELSIEQDLAKRLKVDIGDELTFNILNEEVSAKIMSIRSVVWGSFTPNFYVIFNDGLISEFPTTYMSSFYVSQNKEPALLEVVRKFPQINLININVMLEQAQVILSLLSMVIGFIWLFTLSIGILLLIAILLAGMNLRLYQQNLMRILGALQKQLLAMFALEYLVIGAVSGALGGIAAVTITKYLSASYFALYYPIKWPILIFGVSGGILVMLFVGIIGACKLFRATPISISRKLS